jgi:hypothetical protein
MVLLENLRKKECSIFALKYLQLAKFQNSVTTQHRTQLCLSKDLGDGIRIHMD